MQENEKQKVIIKGIELELKVTVGFWKHCGFTREEASVIESDINHYFNALKLAVFYGNKHKYSWNCLKDMYKTITEQDFEDCEQDYSQEISMATIWYLPKKLRELTLKKIKDLEGQHEDMIKNALDAMDKSVQEESTPDSEEGEDPKKK